MPLAKVLFIVPTLWLVIAAAALAVVALAIVVLVLFSRRPAPVEEAQETAAIDLAALPDHGPPAQGPQLTLYNLPVRLAVVVLAPVGRTGQIPPQEKLPEVFEDLLPGLMQAFAAHQPIFRRWPPQLSTQGFAQAFFHQVRLPGDHGKGTPWCSLAGKHEGRAESFLVGLVFCADRPNAYGQIAVQHQGQWLDILRIKT